MSQSFKFRYDEMRENDPGKSQAEQTSNESDLFYPSSGSVREVCFILPDGSMESFNYAYVVRRLCSVERDLIIIEFTTHTAIIKGVRLEILFFQLMQQLNKMISCTDGRYNQLYGAAEYVVNHITITSN